MPSLQNNAWLTVTDVVNGPETASLNAELLRQLYEELLRREQTNEELLKEVESLMDSRNWRHPPDSCCSTLTVPRMTRRA